MLPSPRAPLLPQPKSPLVAIPRPTPQMSALMGLRELSLRSPWFAADSYWPLLHMPGLTRLALYCLPESLPGCLGRLTQLRSLSVGHEMSPLEDGFQVLASSLPHLPHLSSLTHLVLSLALEEAYAALPLLPALRRCGQGLLGEEGMKGCPAAALRRCVTFPGLAASVPGSHIIFEYPSSCAAPPLPPATQPVPQRRARS